MSKILLVAIFLFAGTVTYAQRSDGNSGGRDFRRDPASKNIGNDGGNEKSIKDKVCEAKDANRKAGNEFSKTSGGYDPDKQEKVRLDFVKEIVCAPDKLRDPIERGSRRN